MFLRLPALRAARKRRSILQQQNHHKNRPKNSREKRPVLRLEDCHLQQSLTSRRKDFNTATVLKQKAFLVVVLGGKERILKTFLIEFNCVFFSFTFWGSDSSYVYVSLFRRLRHY